MIIIDHLLIGTAIGLSVSDDPVIIGITALGSLMPDFDGIFARPGTIKYLIKHRTVTHSLFLAPIYAFIIGLIFKLIFNNQVLIELWYFALMGIVSHLIVDIFNSFGTMLFYPIYKKKIALDLIYEFDPFITLAFLLMSIEFYLYGEFFFILILVLNILAILFYYLFRLYSKRKFIYKIIMEYPTINNIENATVVPAKYWRWKGIVNTGDTHSIFRNINRKIIKEDRTINEIPEHLLKPEIKSYIDYARILDVNCSNKELVLQNLIYSPSVYTLKMKIGSFTENDITISLPNLKYNDY